MSRSTLPPSGRSPTSRASRASRSPGAASPAPPAAAPAAPSAPSAPSAAGADRLRIFVEQAPVAMAMLDRDMRYLAASRRWLQDYALEGRPLVGISHYELFPDLPEHWPDVHRRCLEGGSERAEADPYVRADGHTDWLRWEVRPWRESDGEVGGLLMFSEFVNERHAAELALADREAVHRALLSAMGDGMFVAQDYRFVQCNEALPRMLGWREDRFVGQPFEAVVSPQDLALWTRRFEKRLGTGPEPPARYELQFLVRGERSRTLWVELNARRFRYRGRPAVLGLVRDITERVQAQADRTLHRSALADLAHKVLTQEQAAADRLAQLVHERIEQPLHALRRAPEARPLDAPIVQLIETVRELLAGLQPPLLEAQGLAPALADELRRRREAGSTAQLRFDTAGAPLPRLPADVEYAAFMVARTAIDNALRRPGAAVVQVRLEGDERRLRLEVEDHGSGIVGLAATGTADGLGVIGIHEHALAIGARLDRHPTPGGGARVVLDWLAR